ncbi:hypothetical protein EQM05_05615 [Clostridium sp. JN-9]|nr:hypothetical protein EQM05_05615 [Clostridium sp. JN-9]
MSNDGVIVATVPSQNNKPEEVILYNSINNTYTSISKLNKESQHGSADINDQWVVWTESLDQSFLIWKIHAYNRVTHQDKVVFETPKDSNDNGYPGPEPNPKLYRDEFIWSQVIGIGSNNAPLINIKKYNLLNNKVTDLISQGANPNITKGFIIWMGKDGNNKNSKSALFWNRNNKSEQISTEDEVEYFANSGDSIAWSGHKFSSPNKWVIGFIENGKDQLLLETDDSNAIQFLTMSSRLIAWTEYYKVQVYDRKLKKVVTLQDNDASYSSTFTNENYLYWTTPIIQDSNTRQEDAKKNGIYLTKINILNLNELN